MSGRSLFWLATAVVSGLLLTVAVATAEEPPAAGAESPAEPAQNEPAQNEPTPKLPGLGDPGSLNELSIVTGRSGEGRLVLSGTEGRQQLVVSGHFESGQLRDLTRDVTYQSDPADVIAIGATGLVTTLADGQTTITARHADGKEATLAVTVENFGHDTPVNFPNQVVPIFTKLTCNSGGCHGKASGQNGFKLSLLGFEPSEDYEHLVKEARGRRIFPAAPEQSLLLLKATGTLPHGGGQRIEIGSPTYKLMRRWIAEGAAPGDPEAARVARIEVLPRERTMAPESSQQMVVVAHYTDGRSEDVTALGQYEPNVAEMAEVSKSGLVTIADQTGDVAVMIRYQGHVDVFRATIPLGVEVEGLPPARNFVDELVYKKLHALGLPASPLCDDSTFLRRTTIDIAGRLPTLEETEAFLADTDGAKRDKWIDGLLASRDYAYYFATKWGAILRNKRRNDKYKRGSFAFHHWIVEALDKNRPYDQFVRGIVAASGELGDHPPVVWYREVKDVNQQVEDSAQLFLGLRIQCARCHHHPFEKWSRRDYYSYSAFFAQVKRKPGSVREEERIYHRYGVASAKNPKDNQPVKPTGLGSEPLEIAAADDPRHALVDWMAAPDNPFFARTLANRYWKHFFNRGLVDPEDDMRVTNPATNPELLDALGRHFVEQGFDMKDLVRTICRSNVYQFDSIPNDFNAKDKQNFSRYYPKRLPAEVLLDAVDTLTGSSTRFAGVPAGTRAVQLPDSAFNSYFLTVFGRPDSASACECERAGDANLAQGLHLINSSDVHNKLTSGEGRAARLASDKERSHEEKVREMYLVALSRAPDEEEMAAVMEYIERKMAAEKPDLKGVYEDVLWTMINTKEFLFNH